MRWPWQRVRRLPPLDTSGVDEVKAERDERLVETRKAINIRRYYKETNHYVEDWVITLLGKER